MNLDQFQNYGRKGSTTLSLLINFTLEKIQQHNNKKVQLKRRLQKIYIKIDAKSHLQNLADKLKNKLKQMEMKEAQVVKVRAKTTLELDSEIVY